ncbi:hypothetical protein [Marinobacterium jannaschii]|uniref:hypothetical protein n=1 Tax=Marinobacterium jannaschii TaxID=64970 RepID=UPI0004802F3D|nr:hypothetical protein [Marinobacterium jannaschii]
MKKDSMEFVDSPRCFWRVELTGSYEDDYAAGQKYGRQLVHALKTRAASPFLLAEVVAQFPCELTAIENGFLSELCVSIAA